MIPQADLPTMDLLFDFDGTLTNSAPGILRCFAHALDHVGRPGIDVPVHLAVGPPLYRVFEALLSVQDTALIEPAIVAYRERYEAVGIFENAPYPGVHDALTALRIGLRGEQFLLRPKPPEGCNGSNPIRASRADVLWLIANHNGISGSSAWQRRRNEIPLVVATISKRRRIQASEELCQLEMRENSSGIGLWLHRDDFHLVAAHINDVVSLVTTWAGTSARSESGAP